MSYMETPEMSGIYAVTDAVQNQEATMAQALWQARKTTHDFYVKQAGRLSLAASSDPVADAQRVEDLYAEVVPVSAHTLAAEEDKLREAVAEVYAAQQEDGYAKWRRELLAKIGRT